MKSLSLIIFAFLLSGSSFGIGFENPTGIIEPGKDPVVLEVVTEHASLKDALMAAKSALLEQKFINSEGVQESSFTATRTTGSKADYYIADVVAAEQGGKTKITITFVKVGSGLLKMSKVADKVKTALEN